MKAPLPVEIVGGGVGGLALGLALRRSGIPVTLFEAGTYPRHRVCGEFISGLADSTVTALGLAEILADCAPHRAVTYVVRGRPLPAFTLPGTAWGISRHTLDHRLAQAFVKAGGNLRTGTRLPEEEAPLGRVFAVGRRREGPFWVGLKVHARDLALANDFEVHLGDRAYVGLSRTESGEVNVCGLFAPRKVAGQGAGLLLAYLKDAGLGALAERLNGTLDPATFCVTAAPLGDAAVPPSDRLRIGDACASIPPFTGNGLAMALQGAEEALAPLQAYAAGTVGWEETAAAIGGRQRRRFGRRLRFAALLHPFFLERRRQSLLAFLAERRLIPFGAVYAFLH